MDIDQEPIGHISAATTIVSYQFSKSHAISSFYLRSVGFF
jgi:hypothetical protein